MKKVNLLLLLASALFFRCGVVPPQTSQFLAVPSDFVYPGHDTVRVLSWNVEHFVDGYDNPYIRNAREDDPPADRAERERLLTDAIRNSKADVVVLQEFESAAYARALAQQYLSQEGYRFFAAAESDTWYMNVVLLSKLPLGVLNSYGRAYTPVEPYTDEADFDADPQININNRMWSVDVLAREDYKFNLTGVHLKAGRSEIDTATRIGQINLLKHQARRELWLEPKTNMLMVGDFNATPDSREIKLLTQEKRGLRFIDPLEGTQVFSHPSDKPFWRIDHILPNMNMATELLPGSVEVGGLLSAEELQKLSDHLPMRAVFIARD